MDVNKSRAPLVCVCHAIIIYGGGPCGNFFQFHVQQQHRMNDKPFGWVFFGTNTLWDLIFLLSLPSVYYC